MAHKKGASSSRNGRDSQPQYLGVKKFGGESVLAGNILFCALATVLTLHWALLGLIAALVVQNLLVLGGKLLLVHGRLPR